jgi:choline dehydrogenase-like flavoprotein
MSQDATSSPYDLIVVGSGATGGWVAKRAAEAGLRIALVEAGRKSDDTDYREHVAASALPFRGRTERPLTRLQPQQSQSYATSGTAPFVNDCRSRTSRQRAVPVGRATRWVGGRTTWGRQSYRFSDPLAASRRGRRGLADRVRDLAPHYEIAERYVGIPGQPIRCRPTAYPPPMPMTCAERAARQRKARFNRLVTIGRTPTSRPRSTDASATTAVRASAGA